jgi:L-malate glycosyltransferase
MKVAIIVSRIDQLGPVKAIQALVNYLSEKQELKIVVFYIDKTIDPEVKMMVPVEKLDRKTFSFNEYDVVHTNGIRPDLFAFIHRKKIKYHISTIHNFVFEDLSFTYNKIVSLIFGNIWLILWRRADKLVCVSNSMKTYYEKWYPSSKLKVIYNGIPEFERRTVPDNDLILEIEKLKDKGFKIIGFVGVLTKRKGLDQILNLISIEKEFVAIIIGDGKEFSDLKKHAQKLGIYDRCIFCGFRNNVVNYYKYFDLFVFPSRSEGFGLALVEAVQQKVPVICSDIKVLKELFNSDEVTFFILDNLTSLSDAIKVVVETSNTKADKAFLKYINEYTGKVMADRYVELYQSAS